MRNYKINLIDCFLALTLLAFLAAEVCWGYSFGFMPPTNGPIDCGMEYAPAACGIDPFYEVAHPMMPDPKLTPGATDPHVTQSNIGQTICKDGYTKTVRDVTQAEKNQVMRRYGLPLSDLKLVEIDHWYSLELGGSNDIANLWPQYYKTSTDTDSYLGAREKDVVETDLKRAVCSGAATLPAAQNAIRMWVHLYNPSAGIK